MDEDVGDSDCMLSAQRLHGEPTLPYVGIDVSQVILANGIILRNVAAFLLYAYPHAGT